MSKYGNISSESDFVFKEEDYNVLVVDDSKSTNFIVKKIFQEAGYNCFNVFCLEDARDILEKEKIHYIVLDIHLPDGNGFEIIQQLENSDTKIFVLTTEVDKHFRDMVYQKGVVDFIEKKDNFVNKINQLVTSIEVLEKNKFKTILVVDDSFIIQQQLQALLASRNYNVELADDANIAWEIIKHTSIDLILLDLHLKNSYGLDFLVEKKDEIIDKRKIPVMIISGSIEPSIIRDGLKAGAVDILSKPYIAEEVMLKVDLWIDYRRKEDDILKSQQLLEQYKLAVDRSAIVSKADPNGTIIYVNDEFCNTSGYERDEVLGKNHNIIRDPNTPSCVFEDLWHRIKDLREPWKGELKNIRKDGKPYWVNAIINPIVNTNGDIIEYIAIRNDITNQKNIELEIREAHKNTRDSIEYASLIQNSLMPFDKVMKPYFKDYFVYWEPKDIVGGDIWLFDDLRHEDECLFMFIDCTGHGVPGAFVTMIVKAIEREVISQINADLTIDVSPASIMQYFNQTMKKLLKQESKDSVSNAGFDGGIIYYNRREQLLKFCGAETPLFYIDNNKELNIIKGNRYSVGYKKCDPNYEYKETILKVEEGMRFFCTTDGYLDQNGGTKDFPFGKKRFMNIIKENYNKPMSELKQIFISKMQEWERMVPNNDRNDDMTIIGFEIGEKSDFKGDIIDDIFKYEGVITQNVIATAIDNIESKITSQNLIGTISTITIEYCQNIMHYGKGLRPSDDNTKIIPIGTINIRLVNQAFYKIIAKNVISIDDKIKLEEKLEEVKSLDKKAIRKRYRELRRSGENTHEKGGGIGIYEIAKVSDSIEYTFEQVNDEKYYFTITSIVNIKIK